MQQPTTSHSNDTSLSQKKLEALINTAGPMNIFTVIGGKIFAGAAVQEVALQNGAKINAIIVGEEGRNRKRGLLPVEWGNVTPGKFPGVFAPKGEGGPRVCTAKIGLSRTGKPKLLASDANPSNEMAIVVFRSPIGFRGSNRHEDGQGGPFPGEILTRGVIAQGEAGKMGAGEHLIAVLKRGDVIRVSYSGRLYGGPAAHFYTFSGEKVLVATQEEVNASSDPVWAAVRSNS